MAVTPENLEALSAKTIEILSRPYPGRVLIAGIVPSGEYWGIYYATMGRSFGSQERVLEGRYGNIRTAHSNPEVPSDDQDLFYTATADLGDYFGVSNGIQTLPVVKEVAMGETFEVATGKWSHEKDGQTPRITAVFSKFHPVLHISKIKRNPFRAVAEPISRDSIHASYRLEVSDGEGWGICTYDGLGGMTTNNEDPFPFPMPEDLERGAERLWNQMDKERRVSLAPVKVNRQTGKVTVGRIYNARRGD